MDGLTKISKIEFKSHEDKQAENFRKMVLSMAEDLRVVLIKLSDRLHNMRTLEALRSTNGAALRRDAGHLCSVGQSAGDRLDEV